jgi:hypothetical protein
MQDHHLIRTTVQWVGRAQSCSSSLRFEGVNVVSAPVVIFNLFSACNVHGNPARISVLRWKLLPSLCNDSKMINYHIDWHMCSNRACIHQPNTIASDESSVICLRNWDNNLMG